MGSAHRKRRISEARPGITEVSAPVATCKRRNSSTV